MQYTDDMEKDLSAYRKIYDKSELLEAHIPTDPMALFHTWFYEVEALGGVDEVNAMTLSTVELDGFPKSRVVLLKAFHEQGFVFYTNYNSDKGKAIAQHPQVCLSFFWATAQRQVIVKGMAEKCSETTSDQYFASRPRDSQLGAWVSAQSDVIASRTVLETRWQALEKEWEGQHMGRPPHWGGFVVRPQEIEFWQGRPSRLHDRIRYGKQAGGVWIIERLAP